MLVGKVTRFQVTVPFVVLQVLTISELVSRPLLKNLILCPCVHQLLTIRSCSCKNSANSVLHVWSSSSYLKPPGDFHLLLFASLGTGGNAWLLGNFVWSLEMVLMIENKRTTVIIHWTTYCFKLCVGPKCTCSFSQLFCKVVSYFQFRKLRLRAETETIDLPKPKHRVLVIFEFWCFHPPWLFKNKKHKD